MSLTVRAERPGDEDPIAALVTEAFATARHSSGTEAKVVEGLRSHGALTVSLVAELQGEMVGHIAFSQVAIAGEDRGWLGLGPVAVLPRYQDQGIGARLIEAGLTQIRALGAKGCVLLGEPEYYRRFGFGPDPRLILPGVPGKYFQALRLGDSEAEGEVAYHPAFAA